MLLVNKTASPLFLCHCASCFSTVHLLLLAEYSFIIWFHWRSSPLFLQKAQLVGVVNTGCNHKCCFRYQWIIYQRRIVRESSKISSQACPGLRIHSLSSISTAFWGCARWRIRKTPRRFSIWGPGELKNFSLESGVGGIIWHNRMECSKCIICTQVESKSADGQNCRNENNGPQDNRRRGGKSSALRNVVCPQADVYYGMVSSLAHGKLFYLLLTPGEDFSSHSLKSCGTTEASWSMGLRWVILKLSTSAGCFYFRTLFISDLCSRDVHRVGQEGQKSQDGNFRDGVVAHLNCFSSFIHGCQL